MFRFVVDRIQCKDWQKLWANPTEVKQTWRSIVWHGFLCKTKPWLAVQSARDVMKFQRENPRWRKQEVFSTARSDLKI